MSDSTVAVVRDKDGAVHFAARASQFVQDGLANGNLVDVEVERADAANASTDNSPDPSPARRQSGNRAAGQPTAD